MPQKDMDRREALKRMGLLTAGVAVGAYGTVLWKGRKSKGAVEGSLCLCTEGELTRMFEKAYGGKVKAEVISSILRGQERCIYRISLL